MTRYITHALVGSSGHTTVISTLVPPSTDLEISTTESLQFVKVNVVLVAVPLTSVNLTNQEFAGTSPFATVKSEFAAPLDIVIAGGTSMPKGFDKKVKSVVEELDLPFKIKDIVISKDPRNSVVKGLLTQAIISQKRLKSKKIDEELDK